MANQTYNAGTNVDARGILGYPDEFWAEDPRRGLPATVPNVFQVHQAVLIWYHRDECWRVGKVVRFKNSEGVYEVEFHTDGPRIRDWYHPSLGFIQPDTPYIRDLLRAHGRTLIMRDPRA